MYTTGLNRRTTRDQLRSRNHIILKIMKMKTIKYKSGRITLYHKDNDKYFAGSLILEDAKSTLPKEIGQNINTDFLVEVLRENLSHNLDAIIRTLHSKTDIPEVKTEVLPEPAPVLSESTEDFDSGQDQEEIEQEKPDDLFKSDPPISGMKPGQPAARNILKEYWDLLDFPALFKYLLHTASAATSKISKSIKTKSIIVIEKLFYSEKKEQEKPKVIEKSFKGLDLKLAPKVTCLKNISAGYLSEVKRFAQTNSQILVKGVAIGCLVISVLSIGSILLPLSTAQIGSMVQKSAVGKVEESQKPSPTPDPQKVLANSLEVDPSKDVPFSNDYA